MSEHQFARDKGPNNHLHTDTALRASANGGEVEHGFHLYVGCRSNAAPCG